MKRVAVFCGTATPANPVYMDMAKSVGRGLAERGIGIVYGGGRRGLMGAVADAAMDAGGEVIGVMTKALVDKERVHSEEKLTELRIVSGIHERKQTFNDLADGFVTIAGGIGTMDELWEALSSAQIGFHDHPVGLLNTAGYYDELVAFWEKMGSVGFLRPKHQHLLIVDATLDGLLSKMSKACSSTSKK